MSAIVTGAAGFLGRHLVASLLADGIDVVGFDNFITSDPEDLQPLLSDPRFEFHSLDICSPQFREIALARPAWEIFHLACPTGVPNLGPLALEMLETCFDGTRAVLDVAREHRAAVVLASSAEVYGNPTESPQYEGYTGNVDTLGPRKGYEEGKRVAETLMAIYAERYGVPATVARIAKRVWFRRSSVPHCEAILLSFTATARNSGATPMPPTWSTACGVLRASEGLARHTTWVLGTRCQCARSRRRSSN
jgi:nucleoside-diphosphate-sugar epimerase